MLVKMIYLKHFLQLVGNFFSFSNINIQGIMIVAPLESNANDLKKVFNDSLNLFNDLQDEFNFMVHSKKFGES